jgi:triosephosphate isomerase
MKKLIAGNWKMNGTESGAASLVNAVGELIQKDKTLLERNDFLVCPPAIHLHVVKRAIDYNHFDIQITPTRPCMCARATFALISASVSL